MNEIRRAVQRVHDPSLGALRARDVRLFLGKNGMVREMAEQDLDDPLLRSIHRGNEVDSGFEFDLLDPLPALAQRGWVLASDFRLCYQEEG